MEAPEGYVLSTGLATGLDEELVREVASILEADGFIVVRCDGSLYCVAVDREDLAHVEAAGPWHVIPGGQTFYVMRNLRLANGRRTIEQLHRFLLSLQAGDPREVDHIDGCGLNNSRTNLRIVRRAQQVQNVGKSRAKKTSTYRGVSWNRRIQKWCARITNKGITQHLGCFTDEVGAARAAVAARARLFSHHNEARHPVPQNAGVNHE